MRTSANVFLAHMPKLFHAQYPSLRPRREVWLAVILAHGLLLWLINLYWPMQRVITQGVVQIFRPPSPAVLALPATPPTDAASATPANTDAQPNAQRGVTAPRSWQVNPDPSQPALTAQQSTPLQTTSQLPALKPSRKPSRQPGRPSAQVVAQKEPAVVLFETSDRFPEERTIEATATLEMPSSKPEPLQVPRSESTPTPVRLPPPSAPPPPASSPSAPLLPAPVPAASLPAVPMPAPPEPPPPPSPPSAPVAPPLTRPVIAATPASSPAAPVPLPAPAHPAVTPVAATSPVTSSAPSETVTYPATTRDAGAAVSAVAGSVSGSPAGASTGAAAGSASGSSSGAVQPSPNAAASPPHRPPLNLNLPPSVRSPQPNTPPTALPRRSIAEMANEQLRRRPRDPFAEAVQQANHLDCAKDATIQGGQNRINESTQTAGLMNIGPLLQRTLEEKCRK
jgi:hypothetical protein